VVSVRILVTGASGILGTRVCRLASGRHDVCAAYSRNLPDAKGVDARQLDITDREAVFLLSREFRPDAVIHCAAMTNVDECERFPEKAAAVNGGGTENVAMAARELDAKMVYASTEYVFDGENPQPYTERDAVNPVSAYGKSKLRGEVGARIAKKCAICRISTLYGWNSPWQHATFVTWLIGRLKAKERVTVVTDQVTSPTLADDAAQVLLRIAERGLSGTYNTAGGSCVSRFEFSLKVALAFGLNASLISPGLSKDIKWLAKRPANSCLDVKKTEEALGVKMMTADGGLEFMREQLGRGDAEGWKL